jgi:hypothetical protein
MSSDSKAAMPSDNKATTSSDIKPKKKLHKTSSRAPSADRSANELNRQELARITAASSSYGAGDTTAVPTGATR